ncbi:outer membrane protein OmpA-like peptidoglycan-associated protein [Pontibacter mucosus]|uniref:Outer membrane protein OmpA-like peptidoglycan-associated protein n=1 Tax=Pontibacter mucosus TaxID=1649266 RepID=A0A2T5YSP1_9BACT|nr:OmpA family protein [Pontibacter mucosus]PTX22339.1 outer membrane protein OmpA-like peptidoglycan-associated protein [Pontibacter mucosus]
MHNMPRQKPLARQLQQTGFIALLVLLLSGCGASQYLSKGDKRFGQEEYERAIQFYMQALGKANNAGEVNYKIAEAYRRSNRLAAAEPYYKAAIDANYRKEDAYFYYPLALKANGKYEEALRRMGEYVKVANNPQLRSMALRELENMQQLNEILGQGERFKVESLEALNTDASEFGPYVQGNELIFASTRGPGKEYLGNGEGFLDIYTTTLTDSAAEMGGAVHKYESINSEDLHEAFATFTNDGAVMVFARGNEGTKKGRENVDLFVTYRRANGWTEPKALSINDPEAWDSSPAFTPDGKTLYFSSSRKGGLGGTDIYKSTLDDNGRFSKPENLGPEINTSGNESFVSVGPDGTVYIASDGLPGLGNLDLFRIENGKPVNLGKPVNSPGDDFGMYFVNEQFGFFSSNREGGKGGDDLYRFVRSDRKLVKFFVDGTLYQLREGARQRTVVPNNTVILQDEAGKQIAMASTDAEGKFSFPLDSASTYSVVAEKPNFFTARQRVTTEGKMPAQSELKDPMNEVRLTTTLVLNEIVKEKPIVLENIFYDFDKANIRPDAAVELDKLVQILIDNPAISIELSSHTDSRGSDIYNVDLSQRRAESAVEYIISKGIDRSRITAKGYGESRPVVKNAKTEEQHQRNRRTEFKVVRIQE